jgi:NAD(P)-dependent dehydrogenase (short-subunit alcohol dehydrogenase family)
LLSPRIAGLIARGDALGGSQVQDFVGKVAVVTGAASGIGRGLAHQAIAEGARVVLADVDEAGLAELAVELEGRGGEVRVVVTDVRFPESLDALAKATLDAFGSVHLVFNNAGVMLGGYSWERTDDDWRWVLDVNLFGVINGMRSFIPILIDQGEPAHVVNTASIGGLMSGPLLAPYVVSKHGVVALTESAYLELASLDTPVSISALCPGPIATGIIASERIRPADRADTRPLETNAEREFDQMLKSGVSAGMHPDEVGRIVFQAIRDEKFWIYTHEIFAEVVQARADSIIAGTNPEYALNRTMELLPDAE